MSNTNLYVPDDAATIDAARGRAALDTLRPQMDALQEKDLSAMNVDIALAVSRALGVAPAISAMRERIARDCSVCDQQAIDQLEARAYACATANGDWETANAPPQGYQAVVDEVFEARNILLTVLKSLVAVNLIKQDQIAQLNGGHGHREQPRTSSRSSRCSTTSGARWAGRCRWIRSSSRASTRWRSACCS